MTKLSTRGDETATGASGHNGWLMSESSRLPRPPRSRWTSFVADADEPRPRILHEDGNPGHRVRVEHNRNTILVHLSGETGERWTVFAVDRDTRRWAVGEARTQLQAAELAFDQLYEGS
jgi:hypothetical protein